jgi:thiamine-phosphate pyrophosphorylase
MSSPEALTPQNLRLVDASLNRLAEGLRYLEDIARFLLSDLSLTERLKSLRHKLVESDWLFQKQLLEWRNSVDDVGLKIDVTKEKDSKRDLMSSVVANSRRVQEALRTLEEFSKIINLSTHLTPEKLERARFEIYTIEKDIAGKLSRREKTGRISGIYVIIDFQSLNNHDYLGLTSQAIKGGASVIQLRDKKLDHGELLKIAYEMKRLCSESNVLFIVNDYLDVALAVNADGLHLGQTDLPVIEARKLSPMDTIIGCSTDTVSQAKQAVINGADYVAVGAIFPTSSKDTHVLGTKALAKIKNAVTVPVVAIGGIDQTNIERIRLAGADAAAVISAVGKSKYPEKAVTELVKKFEVKNG